MRMGVRFRGAFGECWRFGGLRGGLRTDEGGGFEVPGRGIAEEGVCLCARGSVRLGKRRRRIREEQIYPSLRAVRP